MRNDISLIFDIDDTLYSQMAPLLEACEESLGGRLADPELFYQAFGKRSQEMFLFSESGQISLHQSRIYRIENTMKDLGIPFTNYGITIAYMQGILKRSIGIFPWLL